MNILLHTIALEPNRWQPARVSTPLATYLDKIASAGFNTLEVFQPHLDLAPDLTEVLDGLAHFQLDAHILSAYVKLGAPADQEAEIDAELERIAEYINDFGFRKIRLFPGTVPDGDTPKATAQRVELRWKKLLSLCPEVVLLIETHNASLADDFQLIYQLVAKQKDPRIQLLFQPVIFQSAPTIQQFQIQKKLIGHIHLQDRDPEMKLVPFGSSASTVPWKEILTALDFAVDASIEFVPSSITPTDQFSIAKTLEEISQTRNTILTWDSEVR